MDSSIGHCLRPFIPEIISTGGGEITLDLLKENNFKRRTLRRPRPKRGDDGAILLLPPPSIEEFPLVVEAIESRNGSRPVFLYRKKLEVSDVKADQNRLLVVGKEAVMQFLRAEEAAAVVEQGLKICGVDEEGRWYALGLKMWASVRQIVVNSGWNQLVAANKAAAGDVAELWGFRHQTNGKLGFAVVLRRC